MQSPIAAIFGAVQASRRSAQESTQTANTLDDTSTRMTELVRKFSV
ncbi:hypothetical protein [Pseudohongiella sp.]|nr:hypothetical protein [Pseudohongiella sp.]